MRYSGKMRSIIYAQLLFAAATAAQGALFAKDLEPWDIWALSDESSVATIDHNAWQSAPNAYLHTDAAANIEAMFDAGARAFVSHPRGAEFSEGQLRLSSIYNWYATDFGVDPAGLLAHLSLYAQPELSEHLSAYQGCISYGYNWTLNATTTR